ncbi:MAG: enoyl-CoA hydratase [Ardenticatenales bacterium]|nr:enoyl-CoA hydratase [Ardenticatenales bacterium]
MTFQMILTEIHERVGLIRLNRPKELNALNPQLLGELLEAADAFDANDAIGCVVIAGNDKAFAAGADIKQMAKASPVAMLELVYIDLWDRLAEIRKPIIAAVSGYCLGGGNELAMACDMIIASDTAKFGQPEIGIGVIPGAGGTQRLARAVGKALAMEMVLNNRWLSAEEALQHGLVNHVYTVDSYLDEALKLAAGIANQAPVAARIGKEAINMAFETSLASGIAHERKLFYLLFATQDQKEGMAAFKDKREPKWQGK